MQVGRGELEQKEVESEWEEGECEWEEVELEWEETAHESGGANRARHSRVGIATRSATVMEFKVHFSTFIFHDFNNNAQYCHVQIQIQNLYQLFDTSRTAYSFCCVIHIN